MAHEIEYSDAVREPPDRTDPRDARRVIRNLDSILDFPGHYLDRSKNPPGYKLRVGDFRVLVDRDDESAVSYAIDLFERKREYRELGRYREVWGSWRDDDSDEGAH